MRVSRQKVVGFTFARGLCAAIIITLFFTGLAYALPQCSDGMDNDRDGLIDYPYDHSCFSPQENDETNPPQCQDGFDNDGDAVTDLADPDCANAEDDSELQELALLQAVTECVFDNNDGTFTAYFGYDNRTGKTQKISVGSGVGTSNAFFPGGADRGQERIFGTGRVTGAFFVVFDGNPITWQLQVKGAGISTTTASAGTVRCNNLVPIAQCIDRAESGDLVGTFGYRNDNNFIVTLLPGNNNHFSPLPSDRGQPQTFLPGTFSAVVSAEFKDEIVWSLMNGSARLSFASAVCAGGCVDVSTAAIKGNLDLTALELANLTKAAADFLKIRARAMLSATRARGVAIDAERAKRKADMFVRRANDLLIQFPAIVKTCVTAPTVCSSVDRSATIKLLKRLYAEQRNAVKRIIARAYFRSTGRTTRSDSLVARAKAVEQLGLVSLQQLPVVATECG